MNTKSEYFVRSLWDNFMYINICIKECQKKKRESKKLKTYFKK